MKIDNLIKQIGFGLLTEAVKQPTVQDVDIDTAKGLNQWAKDTLRVGEDNLPFPFIHSGNKVLGGNWDIPADSWGIVFPLQRQFWLHYGDNSYRIINGRTQPMGF